MDALADFALDDFFTINHGLFGYGIGRKTALFFFLPWLIDRAGMPTTVSPGNTPFTTTALEPMRASAPTIIGPKIFAPAPIITPVSNVGWRGACFISLRAQSDALVNGAVIADFGGAANHDAHAVVNKNAFAQDCAGVNFNTGQKAANVRYKNAPASLISNSTGGGLGDVAKRRVTPDSKKQFPASRAPPDPAAYIPRFPLLVLPQSS